MRIVQFLYAMLLILGVIGCKKPSPVSPPAAVSPPPVYPDHFDAAWVISSDWGGYMGVAIALSGDDYFYWFYSDVGGPGDYPYTGKFELIDGVLSLGEPSFLSSGLPVLDELGSPLYSNEWRVIAEGAVIYLHAVTDHPTDHRRSLIPDVQFVPQAPFQNQIRLTRKIQKVGIERRAIPPIDEPRIRFQ